jgi:hypothetical protein
VFGCEPDVRRGRALSMGVLGVSFPTYPHSCNKLFTSTLVSFVTMVCLYIDQHSTELARRKELFPLRFQPFPMNSKWELLLIVDYHLLGTITYIDIDNTNVMEECFLGGEGSVRVFLLSTLWTLFEPFTICAMGKGWFNSRTPKP